MEAPSPRAHHDHDHILIHIENPTFRPGVPLFFDPWDTETVLGLWFGFSFSFTGKPAQKQASMSRSKCRVVALTRCLWFKAPLGPGVGVFWQTKGLHDKWLGVLAKRGKMPTHTYKLSYEFSSRIAFFVGVRLGVDSPSFFYPYPSIWTGGQEKLTCWSAVRRKLSPRLHFSISLPPPTEPAGVGVSKCGLARGWAIKSREFS